MPTQLDIQKAWAKMIAKAWIDPEFKTLLESDPKAAYNEMGFEGEEVILIPPRPEGFTDEQLPNLIDLVGPGTCSWCCTC